MAGETLEEIDISVGAGKTPVHVVTDKTVAQPSPPKRERVVDRTDAGQVARDAANKVKQAEAAAEAERARSQSLVTERDQAFAQVAEAGQTLFAERTRSVEQQIVSHQSAKTAAIQALRAARESGDFEAETAAQETISTANYQLAKLNDEKTNLAQELERAKAQPQPVQRRQQDPERHPRARAWIDAHPLYNERTAEGEEYRAEATASDNIAVRRGIQRNSDAYFDFINERMERLFGEEHGTIGAARTHSARQEEEPRRQSGGAGAAMRPGGTTDERGATPGERTLNTAFGPIRVGRNHEGKPVVRMTQQLRAQWEEAARWSKMSFPEYAQEQLKIAEEQAQGGTGGLFTDQDSQVFA